MKAIVQTGYGSPDGFELTEIATPKTKTDDQVLIRVHAAALHVGDVFMMRGVPYFTRMVVGSSKSALDKAFASKTPSEGMCHLEAELAMGQSGDQRWRGSKQHELRALRSPPTGLNGARQ